MNTVFPDFIDLTPEARQCFVDAGVTLYDDVPKDEAELIKRIKDAEIITASYIDVTPEVIDQAPKLKFILVPAVGFEWVAHAYAKTKGIAVINCPTHNSHAVAEHAIALLFATQRRVVAAADALRAGDWQPNTWRGGELNGKTLGLVGYGRIGKDIEHMVRGLGMQTQHYNSSSSAEDLDNLLKTSDVVCMCLPLNDGTRGLLDKRRIGLLQPHATLINVGRGATVDQAALYQALKDGQIAAAGLDVFVDEPLTGKTPQPIVQLASLPNVVATPHMAFNTLEASQRLGEELYQNLQACLAGKPINVVN